MSKPNKNKMMNELKGAVLGTLGSYAANRIGEYLPTISTVANQLKGVTPIAKAYSNASSRKEKRARMASSSLRMVSQPVSIGTCINDLYMFRRAGKPQPNADYTVGERFVGRVMIPTDLVTSATMPNSPFSALGLAANPNLYMGYAYPITPSTLGGRVALEASMWQFYAVRRMKVRYMPRLGTNANGAIAIGLSRDSSLMASGSSTLYTVNPSFAAIAQFSPSMMSPVWEPCGIEESYRGTKCWSTRRDSAVSRYGPVAIAPLTALAYDQATIQQVLLGYTDYATTGTIFGSLIVEFEIDFYSPSLVMDSSNITMTNSPAEIKPKPEFEELKISSSNPPPKTTINSSEVHHSLGGISTPIATTIRSGGAEADVH